MATPDAHELILDDSPGDLSLQEAAGFYGISLTTLTRRVRSGEIEGYKIRGVRGHEWRVTRQALEAYGYRQQPTRDGEVRDPRIAELEREVAALRKVIATERARADRADRELGQLMLESGRLRTALARAQRLAGGGEPGVPPEPDPVVMWVPSTGSPTGRA